MFKKINQKLENLFDQLPQSAVSSEQNLIEAQKNFQITNNNNMLENLSYIFSNEIDHNNLANIFSQLSPHFEIGFLLKRDDKANAFRAKEAFVFFQKITAMENLKPIKLPNPGIYKILTTQAHSLLKHFGMENLDLGEKMMSYLIPIAHNYTIVVITQTAEPWAQLKIETLQKTFMKINFSL